MNKKTGFLIINYNDWLTTLKLIQNVESYEILDKILIVDNCSTDESYSKLKRYENNKIEIIKSDVNKGYGAGINLGCRYLNDTYKIDFIFVSNADIEIENEFVLEQLLNDMPSDSGVIAPVIKEHCGLNRGWKQSKVYQEIFLNILLIQRYLRPLFLEYDDSFYKSSLTEVDVMSGCFFLIDYFSLKQIDYFDENVFLYYEENILAQKLKQIHKKIYIDNQYYVFHNHSVSIDKSLSSINKFKQLKKSQIYFLMEYLKAGYVSIFFLKLSANISLCILKIVYFFRNLFIKKKK